MNTRFQQNPDNISIFKKYSQIQERVQNAAARSRRSLTDITVVAVTKMVPLSVVLDAFSLGLLNFGESRPEDAVEKISELNKLKNETKPIWHLIGHIQSRKSAIAVNYFDIIHSVDTTKLAERLSAIAIKAGKEMPIYLECNVSGEASKSGFQVNDWLADITQQRFFIDECKKILSLPGLRVEGLMTIAPRTSAPELSRPHFVNLRSLRDLLFEKIPNYKGHHLSMGMTDDFEVAVEEGATLIRIGRGIFGS